MRQVDFSSVSGIGQLHLRKRRGRRNAGDQNRVRRRRLELEHLAGDACVESVVALVGDDLDPGLLQHRHNRLVPALAVRIGVADEPQSFHAGSCHVVDQRFGEPEGPISASIFCSVRSFFALLTLCVESLASSR